MKCPRTQQECYNPECGKTTTICAYPITLNNCVESEPTIEELQKQLQESKEMIEYWKQRCEAAEKVISEDVIVVGGYDGFPHHSNFYKELKSKWESLKQSEPKTIFNP